MSGCGICNPSIQPSTIKSETDGRTEKASPIDLCINVSLSICDSESTNQCQISLDDSCSSSETSNFLLRFNILRKNHTLGYQS